MLGFQGMFLLGKNGSWFLPLNIFGTFSPWKVELDKFVMNSCPESCGTSFLTFLIGSSSGRDDVKQVFLVFFLVFGCCQTIVSLCSPICTVSGLKGWKMEIPLDWKKETHLLQSG